LVTWSKTFNFFSI